MTQFKEFSWERYQAGDEVQYRKGGVPKEILRFVNGEYLAPIVSMHKEGIFPMSHGDDGKYNNSILPHDFDLVMKPKKRTVWINLYKNGFSIVTCGNTFKSKEHGENIKSNYLPYIGTFPIEIEE